MHTVVGFRLKEPDSVRDFWFDVLAHDLGRLGVEVTSHMDGEGDVWIDFKYDTDRLDEQRTRGAGRKKKGLPYDSPLWRMTVAEVCDWLASHTVEEGMAALGVSRAVYYRRRKSLNELRDRNPDSVWWWL